MYIAISFKSFSDDTGGVNAVGNVNNIVNKEVRQIVDFLTIVIAKHLLNNVMSVLIINDILG